MKLPITLCCALFFACGGGLAFADPVYTLEHIGRSSGLPQSSVRAVTIDKSGFLWVGTETGVARYDGYRFTEITPPFGNGVVMSVHADSRNRLWIRWYGKPLTLYDPIQAQWQVMDGVDAVDTYDGFLEDPHGTVWLSRSSQLLYYDEQSRHLVAVADLDPDPSGVYWPHLAFHHNVVWITAHHEAVGFDIEKRTVVQRVPISFVNRFPPTPSSVRLWVHRDTLWLCNPSGVYRLQASRSEWHAVYRDAQQQVSACEFAADDALWVGTQNAGAIRIHNNIEQRFRRRNGDRTSLADEEVVNIRVDSRRQLWVITPGVAHRWLGQADVDKSNPVDKWERFVHSPDSQSRNPGGVAAYSLAEDRSGVLWLGSEDAGLAKLSPYARKAQLLIPPSTINPHVRTPVVDRGGNVWMGMNQDGVFRFNRATATWTHFSAAVNDPSALATPEVRALLAASDGSIWAGSNSGGVISKFNPATGGWQRFEIGAQEEIVFNFLERSNGQFIIGRQASVNEFDPLTLRVRAYPSPNGVPIRAAIASRTGNVFFGTHQSGVVEFIPGRGFGRIWANELSDSNVFSIYEDRHDVLWIGTWGGGINRLDPKTGMVQVIAKQHGLPDNTIFSILPGKHDDLWVSTYAGLAQIEHCIELVWPCRPVITVLDATNGLPLSEFDAEAAGRGLNGELLFGGLDGLLILNPDDLERNPYPPQLHFASMSLNDKPVAPFWLSSAPPSQLPELELQSDYGSLKLEFSALDFHASGNNRYRYRLARNSEWLSLGANPSLVLNSLTSGRHVVEIMGSNNDGVWSLEPLALSLRVLPPWYFSLLAWSIYAVLLLAGVAIVIKWRERRLRANTLRLEATVAERTYELEAVNKARDEFYANVSHEIRTPLTLLIGTAHELKRSAEQDSKSALADDLVRHSDSLRRYVESLITVSHLQSSPTIAWLQEDVRAYLRSVATDFQRIARNVKITVTASDGNFFVRSYPNALDAIFSNLLRNAISHTPRDGTISITMTAQDDHIAIATADSGSGIDPELLESLFERGSRGGGWSRTTIGYGIGLNLVKQTVLALEGTIGVRNLESGGACFSVTLPRADASLPIASYAHAQIVVDTSTNSLAARHRKPTSEKLSGSLLVIEDHDELRAYVVSIFAANYHVSDAATVADGIAIAKRQLPDVVICDLMLPDGEGFDVVAAIKSTTITDHISVILLTALADEVSRRKGLAHEADLYITKPFDREDLELQVGNLMKQRRRIRRMAAREAWAAKATTSEVKPSSKGESFELRLLATLEAVYSDADSSIDVIASKLAMSRKQLERKTRYCFKCSPHILLIRYRLDKAVVLLKGDLRIGDVAARCGFSSQAHFGALFKKRFGHAPSKQQPDEGGSASD